MTPAEPTGQRDRAFVRVASGDSALVEFWCPGCDRRHSINTAPGGWTWNGDAARPTFTPSVLVRSHETLIDPDLEGDALVAEANRTVTPRCHSFVTDGRIQYLADSTHTLAGHTVDLPVWRPTDV